MRSWRIWSSAHALPRTVERALSAKSVLYGDGGGRTIGAPSVPAIPSPESRPRRSLSTPHLHDPVLEAQACTLASSHSPRTPKRPYLALCVTQRVLGRKVRTHLSTREKKMCNVRECCTRRRLGGRSVSRPPPPPERSPASHATLPAATTLASAPTPIATREAHSNLPSLSLSLSRQGGGAQYRSIGWWRQQEPLRPARAARAPSIPGSGSELRLQASATVTFNRHKSNVAAGQRRLAPGCSCERVELEATRGAKLQPGGDSHNLYRMRSTSRANSSKHFSVSTARTGSWNPAGPSESPTEAKSMHSDCTEHVPSPGAARRHAQTGQPAMYHCNAP
ncbi:hypothetical protein BV20DRAFT_418994 [Pilatotrama ljubarskyi]|nr:hypothetical protein BV20DRAFT_418994 [Pilatotrama ljubarskyi]